jgi:hypothetical protein
MEAIRVIDAARDSERNFREREESGARRRLHLHRWYDADLEEV